MLIFKKTYKFGSIHVYIIKILTNTYTIITKLHKFIEWWIWNQYFSNHNIFVSNHIFKK
jgi:hypothetical protein